MPKRFILVKTQFPATHHWLGVPAILEDVQYLKHPHRHEFYVTIRFKVSHANRDIEFINKKNEIDRYIHEKYYNKFLGEKSCEMIAEELFTYFRAYSVAVLEDNENGGEIYED